MVERLDQLDDWYTVGRGYLNPCELLCKGEFPLTYD